mmetsp:Transcript_68898/g.121693  ORF Transcript_68898/g.121693 Transcript_68898/m.121693 type:complete len:152 (+) Transcript_68898:216-671(+)
MTAVSTLMKQALRDTINGQETTFVQYLQGISRACIAPYCEWKKHDTWDWHRVLPNRVLLMRSLKRMFTEQFCRQSDPSVVDPIHSLVCAAAACNRPPIVLSRLMLPRKSTVAFLDAGGQDIEIRRNAGDAEAANDLPSSFMPLRFTGSVRT